jgi:alkylation response protein AidB-like acyl-CoA dehydrogenase
MVDLTVGPQLRAFREEVRTWIEENKPRQIRPADTAAIREYDLEWQRTMFAGGWAGIAWPVECGGRGLGLTEQLIWYEESGRAGIPAIDCTFVGLSHAGPTLMAHGTDTQKRTHLPAILQGEQIWCQGFSEPGAGSDLAALSTRAVIDGDELVVNGQKIWTSFAQFADYQELLVRTDASGRKHHGLTWVICDMHSPGIAVRPIRTMDGGSEFAEVFYDDVRIPVENVVGGIDEGWAVAMSTLAFERGTAMMASQVRLATVVDELIEQARRQPWHHGRSALEDDEIARSLAQLRADVAALRAMTYLNVSRSARQAIPGPEGSIVKLRYSELHQRVARLAMTVIGSDGLTLGSDGSPGSWTGQYLSSFSATIAGGTSEIQRNIIGERVLGLPR